MNTEHEKEPIKPTGRKYGSVEALMKGEDVSHEVKTKVAELEGETRLVLQLAKLRQKSGLNQEDIAQRLGVQQSAISKLESGKDEELTIREVREYARATGERIAILFGKPTTHVEAVRMHALEIRAHLEALAKIASQDDDIEREIQAFFGEAFFNILAILSKCNDQLPHQAAVFEVRMQVMKDDFRPASSKPKATGQTVLV